MASTYATHFTAGPEHIDMLGHVNNAVWVQWMEQVATEHWARDAAPDHLDAYAWVVIRHESDYRGNVKQCETRSDCTWTPQGARGARIDRHIECTRPNGTMERAANTAR